MIEFRPEEEEKFVAEIAKRKLNPKELIFEQLSDGSYHYRYLNSGIYFRIIPTKDGFDKFKYYFTQYHPNRKTVDYRGHAFNLVDVLNNFQNWLDKHVIKYIDRQKQLQPWSVYLSQFDSEDAKFNEQEIKVLEECIDSIPQYLLTQKPDIDKEELKVVVEEGNLLKKQLSTFKKSKWVKRFAVFVSEEVWDLTKDTTIMAGLKTHILGYFNKVIENIPKLLELLG